MFLYIKRNFSRNRDWKFMTNIDNNTKKSEALESPKDDVSLKKPTEGNFQVTFTNESSINNGKITSASICQPVPNYTKEYKVYKNTSSLEDVLDSLLQATESPQSTIGNISNSENKELIYSKEYHTKDYIDRNDFKGIDLTDLKTFYSKNGNSSKKTYDYLKSYIIENKDDPEILQNTVSRLLHDFNNMYDHTAPHKKVGNNQTEILDKVINTADGEELSGFICGPIHSFIMDTLNECGINAALLSGTNVNGTNHHTLLYQQEDGKYVFNNYGTNIVIDATNIKDAAREVYKRSNSLESVGYIAFQDNGKKSYQEFAFKKEAAFGDEMDKRDYHSESPFDNKINPNPNLNGSVNISTNGNISISAGGSMVYGNSVKDRETELTVEIKKSNETEMFIQSESAGLKIEHRGINKNSGVFFDTKGITSYTSGKLGGCEYTQDITAILEMEEKITEDARNDLAEAGFNDNIINTVAPIADKTKSPIYKTQPDVTETKHLSTFFKGSVGKETSLLKEENTELSNTAKVSAFAGATFELGGSGVRGDVRLLAEDGFELKNNLSKTSLKNSISGGVLADLKMTNTGMCFSIQPGVKFNASSSAVIKPNQNLEIGANIKAGAVVTTVDKDFDVSGGVSAAYKPANRNIVIYGDANAGLYRQRITIEGFNEQTENKTYFSVGAGVKLNPKTSVSVSYNRENDALNKSRTNSSVTIGTKITF